MEIVSKAWDILTDDEKTSLTLSINHSKSTWQAGEIMDKAHYKYLEIASRAKHFFVIFTEYFKKTDDMLIPENSEITWDFRLFLEGIIEERLGYRDAIKKVGKTSTIASKKALERDNKIVEYMEWLRKHSCPLHRDLYNLVKDFDRWNNYRILPESIQEPSAYQRRQKTRLLKHLKNVYNMDETLIIYLRSNRFKPRGKDRILYLPLISDNNIEGYEILKVKNIDVVVKYISKELHLYLFEDYTEADDYGHLVEKYLSLKEKKNCLVGQKFWPQYREMVKKSFNYNTINNIVPKRQNLEEAFRNLDKVHLKRYKDTSIENKSKKSTN